MDNVSPLKALYQLMFTPVVLDLNTLQGSKSGEEAFVVLEAGILEPGALGAGSLRS